MRGLLPDAPRNLPSNMVDDTQPFWSHYSTDQLGWMYGNKSMTVRFVFSYLVAGIDLKICDGQMLNTAAYHSGTDFGVGL
jgi:hypothetical protein